MSTPDRWDKLARDMTIRERFTLAAMQSQVVADMIRLAFPDEHDPCDYVPGGPHWDAAVGELAVKVAEATLAELDKREQERAKQ